MQALNTLEPVGSDTLCSSSSASWWPALAQRLWIYIIIAALFTAILVNYSFRHGRLAVGPTDDDAVYFVDALQRLDLLHYSKKNFLHNLLTFPPHSPFSTGLAVLSFAVIGTHQWAPYVGNGLIILGLLLAVDFLVARRTPQARIAATLFALSFPLAGNCITEFRPDCAVGIVTALGVVLLLRVSPLYASRQQALAVGALAAAALLIKPSFAGFTAYAFAVTWLISAFLGEAPELPDSSRRKSWVSALWWYLLPSLVLALPYYATAPHIVKYIYNNALGKYKGEWLMQERGRDLLRYYWDGVGGRMMLGKHGYIVLGLGLAALVSMRGMWTRRRWRFLCGYILVLGATYAVPTLTRMRVPFFGTTFQALILFAGVLLLALMLDKIRAADVFGNFAPGAAWAAVAFAIVSFQWPPEHYHKGGEWAEVSNRLGRQLYDAIRDRPGSHNARVFYTAPGPIDEMLLRYHALVDGRNFLCPGLHLSADLDAYRREINAADFVVASEPESGMVYEVMTGAKVQTAALEIARSNTNLVEMNRFPALNGKFFYVFVRRSLSGADGERVKPVPFDNPWAPLYGR